MQRAECICSFYQHRQSSTQNTQDTFILTIPSKIPLIVKEYFCLILVLCKPNLRAIAASKARYLASKAEVVFPRNHGIFDINFEEKPSFTSRLL